MLGPRLFNSQTNGAKNSAGIVALVKWIMGQGKPQRGGTSALDILNERYAKGEISKQEFDDKKKDVA